VSELPVTVIDAGVGNLANLERALAHVGGRVTVTADPAPVAASRCLVLPGVGAFEPPRRRLAESGLDRAIVQALAAGAWLFGICVGFQLLFSSSEEGQPVAGLGLLPGRVTRLPATVPVPHIGWNALLAVADHPLTRGLAPAEPMVFVHSYAPEGVPDDFVLACALHGRSFPALVGRGRVLGAQFHPEKSGPAGLGILRRYLEGAHGLVAGDRS
jgi:glutamine amidotransferase